MELEDTWVSPKSGHVSRLYEISRQGTSLSVLASQDTSCNHNPDDQNGASLEEARGTSGVHVYHAQLTAASIR